MLIIGIVVINALLWFSIVYSMKKRMETIKIKMLEEYCSENDRFIIEPKSALYRGADMYFGNVKGNGVIYLTEKGLIFNKLTGQKIEIKRAEIIAASVEESFKGKSSFAAGGKHLVISTNDGNRIGFLVKDAEQWAEKVNVQ